MDLLSKVIYAVYYGMHIILYGGTDSPTVLLSFNPFSHVLMYVVITHNL